MSKTAEKIGGINFVLKAAAKLTRKAFDKSFGSPQSYHKLSSDSLDRVWNTLQEVLIKEGYKKKKKSKD